MISYEASMNVNAQLAFPILDVAGTLHSILTGGMVITMALFVLRGVWEFIRKGSL